MHSTACDPLPIQECIMNKFIKWFKDIYEYDHEFMPDEATRAEHDRINESQSILIEPLNEALKNENEA